MANAIDRFYANWREIERAHGQHLDSVVAVNAFLVPFFTGAVAYRATMTATRRPWIDRLVTRGMFLTASLAGVSMLRWVTVDNERCRQSRGQ